MSSGGGDHMQEFGFVGRAHDDHVGKTGQIGDIIDTGMRGTVIANHPGPVDGETNRQLLDRHIMHNLIIAALQECGIERAEGPHPLGRKAGGKGHRMLLGDPDIEHPVGKPRPDLVEPGAGRHRCRDRDNPVIRLRRGHQPLRKHRRVAWRVADRFLLRAGNDVEFRNSVIFFGGRAGKGMALALFGHHMNQHRPTRVPVANVFQHRQKMRHVMAVNRPDMKKAKLAEHRIATDQITCRLAGAPRRAFDLGRKAACHLAHQITDRVERLRCDQTRQIAAHRADRLRDRHVIVVQNDDQPRIRGAGIVHPLERHAGAHRAVTNHRDNVTPMSLKVASHSHAEPGGNRGR